MTILHVKALHIIFVITWFSGLFYIVRLFIYYAEAANKEGPTKLILQTQYQLMSKRLWYIITWPSAVLASLFAFWMLYLEPSYLLMPWMQVKLFFVCALYFYHAGCQKIFSQQQKNKVQYGSFQLRIWNEVATVLLFAIVFLAVLKTVISWVWAVVAITTLGGALMISIRAYKKIKEKKSWESADPSSEKE